MAGMIVLGFNLLLAIVSTLTGHLFGVATMCVVATLFGLIVLEAIFPAREDWSYGFARSRARGLARLKTDLFFVLFVNRIAGPGLSLVPPFLAMGASGIHEALHIAIWPSSLPLVVRVALLAMLGPFVQYWWHRAMHRVPILWRLHRVHHAPEQMSVLKSAHNHPLEDILNIVVRTLPFVVIGVGPEELMLVGWMEAVIGLLGHANMRADLGFVGAFVTTPAQHALHHSKDESASNFGDYVSVWDRVFGTFRQRRDVSALVVGVDQV